MSEQSISALSSRPTKTIVCRWCREVVPAERVTKSYCSNACAGRHKTGVPRERNCLQCGKAFQVVTRADCARKHCSRACAKKRNTKKIKTWVAEHPESAVTYRQTYVAKNPGLYRDKARRERLESIRLLGGSCCVCAVTNPNWLHVDYVPTNRNSPHRHPRHLAFVKRHLSDFRLLCANHHYELTLTGRIEGTEITQ